MSKEREKEYLEKLGVPSKDYSSVPVGRTFSLDEILGELSGNRSEKPADAPAAVEKPVDTVEKPAVNAETKPTAAEKPAPASAPKPEPKAKAAAPKKAPAMTPAPTERINKNDIFAKLDIAEGKAAAPAPEPKAKPEAPAVKPEPKAEDKAPVKPEPSNAPETAPAVNSEPTKPVQAKPAVDNEPTKALHRPVKLKVPMKDEEALKLFSTIEIKGQPDEYSVTVEEGGEPKVDGNTVVFAPPVQEKPSRKRAAKKPRNPEAEPEQLFFEGAGPKNIITTRKEAPVEAADADKVAVGFGESVENSVRENARSTLGITEGEPEESHAAPADPEESHGEPDDTAELETTLKAQRSDGILKSFFLGAAALILLILDVFVLKGESVTGGSDIASVYLFISIIASAITLALAAPIVRKGFKQITSFSVRAEGAAVICTFAAIIQNVILILNSDAVADGTVGVYNFIPAVMLLFSRLGELRMIRHIRGNLRFIGTHKNLSSAVMLDEDLTDDLVMGQISGEPRVCAPRRTDGFVGAPDACRKDSSADATVGKLFAFTLIIAAVIAVFSMVFRHVGFTVAFSVFTAALCAGTPLMSAFVTVLPLTRINNVLNRKGGAILNFEAAVSIADANCIVVSDTDAFPDHSIILHGMSLFNNAPMDTALCDTVSVLSAAGGALGKVFEGSIADKSMLPQIDSIEYVDEMGVVCRSLGRELLLGSRDFMKAYQIPVPSSSYEARISGGDRHVFYLAVNMELAAMYVVTYGVSDVAKRRLRRAEDAGLTLLIATKDTNVTKEILSNRMKLDNSTVKVISARALDKLERSLKKAKTLPAGIIVSDECCALPETAVCAAKLKSRVSFNLASLIASTVIGLIFVAIFSLASTPSAIEAWKILVYALFWTLPVLVLSSAHK